MKCWFASISEFVADIKNQCAWKVSVTPFFYISCIGYTLFHNYAGVHISGKPEIKFAWNLWFSVRRIRVFWDVTLCPDVSKGPQVVSSLFSDSCKWRWMHAVRSKRRQVLAQERQSLYLPHDLTVTWLCQDRSAEQASHHLTVFVNTVSMFGHFIKWQVFSSLRFVTCVVRRGVSATRTYVCVSCWNCTSQLKLRLNEAEGARLMGLQRAWWKKYIQWTLD